MVAILSVFLWHFFVLSPFCLSADILPSSVLALDWESELKKWGCPGMAIAVVEGDKLIFCKSFGFADTYHQKRVTKKTQFALGSLKKGMVAFLALKLEEEKKLKITDPVKKHLKNFHFEERFAEDHLLIEDLLSHRSGLEDHVGDLLFVKYQKRENILNHLKYFPLEKGFRKEYGYQNLTYLLLPNIFEKATEIAFEDLLYDKLLSALNISSLNRKPKRESSSFALPYVYINHVRKEIPWSESISFSSAGGGFVNIIELASWLKCLMNRGSIQNRQLISIEAFEKLTQPMTFIDWDRKNDLLYPKSSFLAYSMGFIINGYNSHRIIEHGGNIPGMSAKIGWIPEKKLGVAILVNQHESLLPHAIMYQLFDEYLEKDSLVKTDLDWLSYLQGVQKSINSFLGSNYPFIQEKPSLPQEQYLGEYDSLQFGTVQIEKDQNQLYFVLSDRFRAKMLFFQNQTFDLLWEATVPQVYPGNIPITFHLNEKGDVESMHLEEIATFVKR